MGEKKDKENMAKKRTQILDSGGLALPYFLFPQFFLLLYVWASKIYVDKGQLISKANCQGPGFSQKMNENTSHTSKNEFIRSFFGRILGQKKTFRYYLTFT